MSDSQAAGETSPAVGSDVPGGALATEPMSLPEACFSIFFAPSRVFADRQRKGWVLPLIILTVFIALLFYGTRPYLQPAIDAETIRQVAAAARSHPEFTEAQRQGMIAMQEKVAGALVVAFVPVVVVAIGFVLWLTGRFVDSTQTLSAAFVVATFAYYPKLLAQLAAGVIGYIRDASQLTGMYTVTLGPGYFLPAGTTSPVLIALVGRLDIITLWVTVLLAKGLHVTGKVSKGQAYAVAAVVWIIGALPGLFGAFRAMG